MDEGLIWDHVIRWGIAQNTSLSSNPKQWSDADFLIVKNTLQNCLPLIRYFQISYQNIFKKVRPYQCFGRNLPKSATFRLWSFGIAQNPKLPKLLKPRNGRNPPNYWTKPKLPKPPKWGETFRNGRNLPKLGET